MFSRKAAKFEAAKFYFLNSFSNQVIFCVVRHNQIVFYSRPLVKARGSEV